MHYALTICLDPKMKLQNILPFPQGLDYHMSDHTKFLPNSKPVVLKLYIY